MHVHVTEPQGEMLGTVDIIISVDQNVSHGKDTGDTKINDTKIINESKYVEKNDRTINFT